LQEFIFYAILKIKGGKMNIEEKCPRCGGKLEEVNRTKIQGVSPLYQSNLYQCSECKKLFRIPYKGCIKEIGGQT
jgi:uncharacterized protein with PIN domain